MFTATGPSPSQRPTKQGVAAGGALAGDVDYRDIPNTQIRKVKMVDLIEHSRQASEEMQVSQTILRKQEILSDAVKKKSSTNRILVGIILTR